MPSASAAPVRSLWRGRRAKESETRRRNIGSLFRDLGRGLCQRAKIHHEVGGVDVGWHADRIAAALLANRRDVNCGGAMAADHVLAVLPITFGPANAPTIESVPLPLAFFPP